MNYYYDYIKQELNDNPKYRELLFRRGYLLTDKTIENTKSYPFYNQWIETELSGYRLYVHNKQTSYKYQSGNTTIALVGHAYNPFTGDVDENNLLRNLAETYEQSGTEAYFEKLSEFSGNHVIILVSSNDDLIVCQDALSLTGCFFGEINNQIFISEHAQLIADICNLKMDPMVEKLVQSKCYNIGNRHLPGSISPYKEVKRLGANTYLKYSNHNDEFSIKRFFPIKPHEELTDESKINERINQVGGLLHNALECCTEKWSNCAISLTGGTDSKTTLACAKGLYDRFKYFSFNSKPQELIDAEGAKKVCEKMGLPHTLYNISEENEEFKYFKLAKAILCHNAGYCHDLADNEIRKYIFLHNMDAYDVEVKSWGGEVVRVFLERKYNMKMPEVLNERNFSIFQTRYFGQRELLNWSDQKYCEFLQETGLDKPLFNYEHADSFYWEVRMACWGQEVTSSQNFYHPITMPLNNRKILEMFLAIPRELRKDDSAHRMIMEHQNPDILDANVEVRNLYFHGYRTLLEKMFFKYKTFCYKSKIK